MAGDLRDPQGLHLETIGDVNYDDNNRILVRRTKIILVDRNGDPRTMWPTMQNVLKSTEGLKIGLNINSNHDLKLNSSNKSEIEWAVGENTGATPTLAQLAQDDVVTNELRTTFKHDGKWFGFTIPRQATPPNEPALFFQVTVTKFKLDHRQDVFPAYVIATEGRAKFREHFVMGFSVFTRGRNNSGVNFASTVIAFPP
jgi:hypothetical protein